MCKGSAFFETSQAFYGKSDRKRLIIDISQQFVCVHTVHFSFVHFCFSSFHVSRSKHAASRVLAPKKHARAMELFCVVMLSVSEFTSLGEAELSITPV